MAHQQHPTGGNSGKPSSSSSSSYSHPRAPTPDPRLKSDEEAGADGEMSPHALTLMQHLAKDEVRALLAELEEQSGGDDDDNDNDNDNDGDTGKRKNISVIRKDSEVQLALYRARGDRRMVKYTEEMVRFARELEDKFAPKPKKGLLAYLAEAVRPSPDTRSKREKAEAAARDLVEWRRKREAYAEEEDEDGWIIV
ncbi:hypothetical protein MKZ38_008918 [Zalerion maritima]|uniref:Uncharacterized protein n=1 Tax=Zalerion maritima TaxID=339359 RepID=A0AAD5WND6_9PEZI|nr:hypothetical protein MKZ38_008918 [Zalerion maritima]